MLAIISLFSLLSSRDAANIASTSNLLPSIGANSDVASALKVLEMAQTSISGFQSKSASLPFATISYAQTIDGSM
jgi:hypothetical protein